MDRKGTALSKNAEGEKMQGGGTGERRETTVHSLANQQQDWEGAIPRR